MESQSPNPLDITTEMMSQTTSNLLANMAMDVSLNASGASDGRRPLHPVNDRNTPRPMGPNETLYRNKHDGFVTKTIRSYAARGGAKLPKFRQMNDEQRREAMDEVDALLSRLNCGPKSAGSANIQCSKQRATNETFGSATTLGEGHNETFGSATTLGEDHSQSLLTNKTHNTKLDQSTGSVTTMGEGRKSLNQSISLLEESMVLLSEEEEEAACDDQSRLSGDISPIEQTRHASKPHESTIFNTELSPAFSTRDNKRCASNSGKRGLKSRVRLDDSVDAESSLLNHFEGQDNLFCEEDAFSCGSPIQRRFSCDLDKDVEFKDEEESRFSYQDHDVDFGNDDFVDDHNEERCPAYQQSQWSTFQNADPKLTYQEGEEEDDSPVRRRAIRFDGQSQRLTNTRKKQSAMTHIHMTVDEEVDESEEDIHLEEKMADMGVEDDANNSDDDPIQTVKNLSRRAKALESHGVDSSLLDEVAPTDIRMKDGAHFRMDPLKCRQTKEKGSKFTKKQPKSVRIQHPKAKSKVAAAKHYDSESENELSDPEPSFTDPISRYPTRVAARLNGAFEFIASKEHHDPDKPADMARSSNESRGVLLSMPIDQCVGITSKLLIQTIKSSRLHQRSMNGLTKKSKRFTPNVHLSQEKDVLAGGTLIILRDKADLPQWEVALREYTSLSVMNHAEMQSSLRKLANTAAKCAGFDVVLSTYDAIKAKEVTVPVDENGRAMLDADSSDSNEADGGWLTSRVAGSQSGAQAPRKCHQLSVLHRMSWHRLIMLDVLGRKGFLIKPGTARVQAAIAINATSRFILFEKEDDGIGKPIEKFKDDRRQLRSVTTALQLPTTLKLDKFINDYVLDVNKVGRGNDVQLNHESSSSELEESFEECSSDNEDLTEPCSY